MTVELDVLRHEHFMERGHLLRQSNECAFLLENALHALKHGKSHVVLDHMERVIDIIQNQIGALKEAQRR